MPVVIGKHAGFCYGVKAAYDRAMEAARCAAASGEPCWMLGSLTHNEQVMDALEKAGLRLARSEEEAQGGSVLIRSHGVAPEVIQRLALRGVRVMDATCPNVQRVHTLVAAYSGDGGPVIIVGEPDHPEVIATRAWCQGPVYVVKGEAAVAAIPRMERALVVAQTTLRFSEWTQVVAVLRDRVESLTVKNTICRATDDRQREAEILSKDADVVLVVGSRQSANTRALYETCGAQCGRVYFIESAAEIPMEDIAASDNIVITAGASTPEWSLKEVATRMNDLEKNIPQEAEGQPESTPVEASEAMPAAEPVAEAPQTPAPVAQEEPAAAPEPQEEPAATPAEEESAAAPAEEEKKAPAADTMENSFLADIEATLVTIRPGQTITGTVVQVTDDEVCVNIGYKSDGLVKKSDLVDQDVKMNDKIEVEVVKVNDGEGNVLLSQRNIVNRRNWDALMEQYENDEYVEGVGKEAVKGGLIANVNGVRAFIPASQLSQRYVERIEDFVGQPMKLKIIEVDKAKKRIVASRKAVILEEQAAIKHEIWEKLVEGEIVNGIVRRLTDFGAFVDIGGVDGLVHVTDLSWGRVRHPSEVVSPNQEIQVKILALDPERERIQLGYKQIQPRPWDVAEEKYPAGSIVEGKVVRITTFGAFVELEPGLDGLVHISQCALTRIAKVEDAVQVGQTVRVKVLGVDPQAKRISLSVRAAMEEEAFNYSDEIPGDDMMGGDISQQEYATPVDYTQMIREEEILEEPLIQGEILEAVTEPETAEAAPEISEAPDAEPQAPAAGPEAPDASEPEPEAPAESTEEPEA